MLSKDDLAKIGPAAYEPGGYIIVTIPYDVLAEKLGLPVAWEQGLADVWAGQTGIRFVFCLEGDKNET